MYYYLRKIIFLAEKEENMKKKILCLFLTLVMTISVAPAMVGAATPINLAMKFGSVTLKQEGIVLPYGLNETTGKPFVRIKGDFTKGKSYYLYDGVKNKRLAYVKCTTNDRLDYNIEYGRKYIFAASNKKYSSKADIKALVNYNPQNKEYLTRTKLTKTIIGNDITNTPYQVKIKSTQYNAINLDFKSDSNCKLYFDGKMVKKDDTKQKNVSRKYRFKGKKLKPNSKHKIKVAPYLKVGKTTYTGTGIKETVRTAKFTKTAAPMVTKLTKNMVAIRFIIPKSQRFKGGSIFYVYAGKKKIKTIQNNGKKTKKLTYEKKNAAKKKYKVVAKCPTNKKKYKSKKSKAKKNYHAWTYPTKVSSYKKGSQYVRPTKIYYRKGKLMMDGFYLNTQKYDFSEFKVDFVFTSDKKEIVKKRLSSGPLPKNKIREFTVVLSNSGKRYDLRNSEMHWKYIVNTYKG